jgi:hypothetical protein
MYLKEKYKSNLSDLFTLILELRALKFGLRNLGRLVLIWKIGTNLIYSSYKGSKGWGEKNGKRLPFSEAPSPARACWAILKLPVVRSGLISWARLAGQSRRPRLVQNTKVIKIRPLSSSSLSAIQKCVQNIAFPSLCIESSILLHVAFPSLYKVFLCIESCALHPFFC